MSANEQISGHVSPDQSPDRLHSNNTSRAQDESAFTWLDWSEEAIEMMIILGFVLLFFYLFFLFVFLTKHLLIGVRRLKVAWKIRCWCGWARQPGRRVWLAMVYCQNFSLNSIHPSDKVRPSVRAMPAIKERERAWQLCVSATFHQKSTADKTRGTGVGIKAGSAKRQKEGKERSGEDTLALSGQPLNWDHLR